MKIIEGLKNWKGRPPYPVLTIGNFDGVHLGHQQILSRAVQVARENAGTSIAMTFWPHPAQFFSPDRQLQYLTDTPGKCALMSELGIQAAIIVPFTREFSQIEADAFVRHIVAERIGAQEVVVGFNFSFGRGKKGDADFLKREAAALGRTAHIVPPCFSQGELVSSTRIRALLREGDVERAAGLLGRAYGVRGEVIEGAGRGAGIGFPTANVDPGDFLVPARGVYVARVLAEGTLRRGVVNVGVNPTFGGETLSIEAYLLDFDGDLYGKQIEVRFCRRLRPEKKFPSVDALVAQIQQDVRAARLYFDQEKTNAP